MGSQVSICNATNLNLNIAISQVGPLYYQNKVKPGECWQKNVGKVWFTIKTCLYTGEENVYTHFSMPRPITSYSLVGIGAAATFAGARPKVSRGLTSASFGGTRGLKSIAATETSSVISIGSAATLLNNFATGAGGAVIVTPAAAGATTTVCGVILESTGERAVQIVNEKLSISSSGWYMGKARIIYICGGPPKAHVTSEGNKQTIHIFDGEVEPIYLTEEMPEGFKVTCLV